MPSAIDSPGLELERTLHERFGLEQFRPGQREVIEEVLRGRDVLCVMPTGGGKSLCYQLPALVRPGLTLVVSPLIALMKDQVDGLTARGIRATLINSTLDPDEQRLRIQQVEAGQYDLVYVAPERFRSSRFVEAMSRVNLTLLAIDEAHCISEWGHDFRPDYAKIGQARRRMGKPPCIALTATATDVVRRDIADQLDLDDPAQFVTGFDRPNLSYGVVEANRDREKLAALADVLGRTRGSAVVYASSRAKCESVAQFLTRELRRSTVVYHAGLTRDEREQAQNDFMSGGSQIVVATNAFGMGVDKPDIRAVVHFNYPGTVEAYYQEAGRAGRDGQPAECVLLYSAGDRMLQEMFIENEYPPKAAVYRVYDFLRDRDEDPIELTHAQIREMAGIEQNESAIGTALKILEGAGGIERFLPRENMAIVRIDPEAEYGSLVDRLSPQASVQRIVLLALEGLVSRRYGEPVYFHPDSLAAQLGLDRPALVRAIKALTDDLPIDYIPPFRGNAVRVIDRSRRARDLEIDFSVLEDRKRREYAKLDRMIKYAQARSCRRAYILGYFGDQTVEGCGRCDNCGGRSAGVGASACTVDTEAGRLIILKALSGVARAKGRAGKNLIALMLIGSTSEKVQRAGLKDLSTFGILASFKQAEVAQLLDSLCRADLVESRDIEQHRPVLDLTESGRAYLKAPTDLTIDLSDELVRKICPGARESEPGRRDSVAVAHAGSSPEVDRSDLEDEPLWQTLKAMRLAWAREYGLPPHTIFHNSTLEEIVRNRPATPADLLAIKGFGPSKLEKFGKEILNVVSPSSPSHHASPAKRAKGEAPANHLPYEREVRVEPRVEHEAEMRRSAEPPPNEPKPGPASASPNEPNSGTEAKREAPSRVSTEEWTWRLLDRGFQVDEVAAIRALERAVVLRHVAWQFRQGKSIPLTRWLPPDLIHRWSQWQSEHGSATPPPDAPDWPGLWPLFLAGGHA